MLSPSLNNAKAIVNAMDSIDSIGIAMLSSSFNNAKDTIVNAMQTQSMGNAWDSIALLC